MVKWIQEALRLSQVQVDGRQRVYADRREAETRMWKLRAVRVPDLWFAAISSAFDRTDDNVRPSLYQKMAFLVFIHLFQDAKRTSLTRVSVMQEVSLAGLACARRRCSWNWTVERI